MNAVGDPLVFASIVEGHGEELALRTLFYKILEAIQVDTYPQIARPWRIPKGTMLHRTGELERYAGQAILEAGPTARLFVLMDADGDCPAELGPRLSQRLATRFPGTSISINIANSEYETWFIASLESIVHTAGITQSPVLPRHVESIRGAKEWLSGRMARGNPYDPISHQTSFSSHINVPLARQRSQSFDRFCREVERLLTA